jgi:hypothetical protein
MIVGEPLVLFCLILQPRNLSVLSNFHIFLIHFSEYPLLIHWILVVSEILISTFSLFILFTRFFSLFYGEDKYEWGIVNLVYLVMFQHFFFFCCFVLYSLIHMCIHCLGHFCPLSPTPLSPPTPHCFQAESVLLSSPNLWERRHKK